ILGDDKGCTGTNTDNRIKNALREAKACGLHCLVHAGENGSAASVSEAVYDMFAERIGHGYHILDNASIYSDMKSKNVHFEVRLTRDQVCPLSSRLTGSVSCDWSQHPVHYFIRDGINFSISTDDPTVTGQWLIEEEKMLLTKVGLTAEQLKAANLRAAKACFLGGEDKEDLLRHICARRDSANICA
uniref:Adenosine deaminase n=1 Tax=Mesocestoides corti TaxID=53468 RepID=A0A5K3FKU4_MESCO